jgi:hypothetical protein
MRYAFTRRVSSLLSIDGGTATGTSVGAAGCRMISRGKNQRQWLAPSLELKWRPVSQMGWNQALV